MKPRGLLAQDNRKGMAWPPFPAGVTSFANQKDIPIRRILDPLWRFTMTAPRMARFGIAVLRLSWGALLTRLRASGGLSRWAFAMRKMEFLGGDLVLRDQFIDLLDDVGLFILNSRGFFFFQCGQLRLQFFFLCCNGGQISQENAPFERGVDVHQLLHGVAIAAHRVAHRRLPFPIQATVFTLSSPMRRWHSVNRSCRKW